MPVQNGTSPSDVISNSLKMLQRLAEGKRTVWGTPIPWIATPVDSEGFEIAPDYLPPNGGGSRIIICEYEVPRGYTTIICGLVLGYAGQGGPALPGQVGFTVDVNNPAAGITSPQSGYAEKDYANVVIPRGSFVGGPVWPVEFKHDQNETIRIKGYTVSSVATGAGNFLYAALVGFQWPTQGWEG